MTAMPELCIFPMEDMAAGEWATFYWWSAQPRAPYIQGLENTDWGGPFTSLKQASDNLAEIFGEEASANAHIWSVYRDQGSEPRWFWPMKIWHYFLWITIPLDELSERILSPGLNSPELQSLFESMRVQILPKNDKRFSKILMYDSAADQEVVFRRLNRKDGEASFALPLVIAFRTELSLTAKEVASLVAPAVSIDLLYPDIIETKMVPKR